MPMRRSSLTECWVVLVLSSPTESRYGTSVTWTKQTCWRPTSLRSWRMASRNGSDSMSPTVPPISTITTWAPELAAAWRMRALISSVTCGMTWMVAPEEVAPALLLDDRVVDRAGGHVGDPGEVLVGEPLVVPEVEVGLGAVLGDEDLAVLEGAHRARVHVEIGVALLQRHPHAARLEEGPERRGGDPLAETRDDAPGHEDVLHRRLNHMPSHRPTASARIAPASADTPGEFRSVRLRRSRLRYRRRASSSSAWRRAVASWGAEPSMRQSSSSRSSPATGSIRVVARPPGPSAFTSR